jgi:hypothetical protein
MENNPVTHSFIFQTKKRAEKKMTESEINIAFRIVFHSILNFFRIKKYPIMQFYLFIFAVTVKCIVTYGTSLD